jgi:DNA-binding MarR family transcriptional regulator
MVMEKSRVDAYALDLEVLRQFRLIFKSVRRHFQSVESVMGISGAQLWAVSRIAEQPGIRVTELAKAMSIHQTTASNLVEKLVELGFVARERDSSDGRVVLLRLTDKGAASLAEAPGPVRGLLPDALGKLPFETLESLHANLTELLSRMQDLEPQGRDTPLSEM